MAKVTNIRTRYAIVKRAQKILKEVDAYFEDAADFKDNASRFMRAMELARAAIALAEKGA